MEGESAETKKVLSGAILINKILDTYYERIKKIIIDNPNRTHYRHVVVTNDEIENADFLIHPSEGPFLFTIAPNDLVELLSLKDPKIPLCSILEL